MKKQFLTVLLILGFSTPVLAQDLPDGSVSVDFAFVSNYVFRGNDLFTNAAVQRGEKITEHSGAPAFQPSITFGGPEGMYFNIWGSYALTHRADTDSDKVLQTAPGGSDIFAGSYNYTNPTHGTPSSTANLIHTAINTAVSDLRTNGVDSTYQTAQADGGSFGLPLMYKEQNGLSRLDETDFTFGYGVDTDVGTMDFGVVTYIHPGLYKSGWGNFLEFFVSFTPYAVPFLSLSTYADEESNEIFSTVALAPSIELAEGTELGFNVAANHKSREGMAGISHYDVGVSFSTGGLSIGVNGSYRENFYLVGADGDAVLQDDTGMLQLFGGSTATDGMVTDNSRTSGYFNSWANTVTGIIVSEAYTKDSSKGVLPAYSYTPRQKLPRWVYYTSIAYTVEM